MVFFVLKLLRLVLKVLLLPLTLSVRILKAGYRYAGDDSDELDDWPSHDVPEPASSGGGAEGESDTGAAKTNSEADVPTDSGRTVGGDGSRAESGGGTLDAGIAAATLGSTDRERRLSLLFVLGLAGYAVCAALGPFVASARGLPAVLGTPGRVEASGARLNGGVTGHHVSLTDTVVLGSVVGERVELTDCLVLGVVGARERLEVTDSTCYTLNATGRTELSGVDLVLPQALVGSSLTMAGPVRVVGLQSDPVTVAEADHVEQEDRHYLTLAHRLLNLERVEGRLETLETTLERVLVSEDLADASRDQLLGEFELATD